MELNAKAESNAKTILKVDKISVSFGANTVLCDFSLDLHSGERIVIEGPNGCGKTTLLKCILGMVKPQKGSIVFSDGVKTAYCKQGFTEGGTVVSVYEVVSMGLYKSKSNDRAKVERAMCATGVEHLASRAFGELSGGEKQRVNLARCICQDANLLLLDEPSSFLDVAFRDEFVAMMHALPSYMAAIVVSHDEALTQGLNAPVQGVNSSMQGLNVFVNDAWKVVRLGGSACKE